VASIALAAGVAASAQAPLLQDGATALRQARLDFALGQAPLPPLSVPFLEAGWGGADAGGIYTPLINGEGSGHGTEGWGLGLQGRYGQGGWSISATALALRDHGRTIGILQRAAVAYQTEAGWRMALEQTPFAWGSGLNGGNLLGDAARSFPHLTLATPEVPLPLGRWRLEAFAGRLEWDRPIPEWIQDREARVAAQQAGNDVQCPLLWGGFLRGAFGSMAEVGVGSVTMGGGQDAQDHATPTAARTQAMVDLKFRLPALAEAAKARGASVYFSHTSEPDNRAVAWSPARLLGGLQLVWEDWNLAAEYAGAAPQAAPPFSQPTYLAGFSSRGDSLGSAFGSGVITRTLELGTPFFLEGQGSLRLVRATAATDDPVGRAFWFLQAEARWRTSTGRSGFSLATARHEFPSALGDARWGWAFSCFQAFRIF
jgi:hypothetical protein